MQKDRSLVLQKDHSPLLQNKFRLNSNYIKNKKGK
jgi:hypothetical protein